MTKSIYLLGAGGHGKVILDTLCQKNIKVTGILDPNLEIGTKILGVSILGKDDYVNSLSSQNPLLVNGVGANPYVATRRKLFSTIQQRGFHWLSVVHPSVSLGSHTQFGEGCQIMAGVVIQCGTTLGNNVVVNTNASIDHDCYVQDHSFISPGVTLCGNITIQESAFIGANATILPGVHIGSNVIVGAGTVVVESIPSKWIVVGNPAIKVGINEQN
jgi:UDP-perosamine 4-acetyltransferase